MSRLGKLLVAVALMGVGVALGTLWNGTPEGSEHVGAGIGGGFTLVRPAFAQAVGTGFPHNEVGISLYVNANTTIDLVLARQLFELVEDETDNYVIGVVELEDHYTEFWPHVYIDKDGWIMVYYTKEAPASMLMPWRPNQTGPITETTLQMALTSIGRQLGRAVDMQRLEPDAQYYHWQYPDARRVVIAFDAGNTSFRYTLPRGLTVYEGSWMYQASASAADGFRALAAGWTQLDINDTRIARDGPGTLFRKGILSPDDLYIGETHTVTLSTSRGWVQVALVFIFA